jgi:hypothetical protein
MKYKYYFSVDLDVAGIEADNESEALEIANQQIKDGSYTLNVVDKDEVAE